MQSSRWFNWKDIAANRTTESKIKLKLGHNVSTSKFMVKAGGRRSSCFFFKYYCTFERRLMPFWRVQGGRMWGRQDAWPHCWVPVTTDTPRIWTCATALQSDALWVKQHLPVMLQLSLSLMIPHYLCKRTTKLQTISNLPKKKDSPQVLFYNFTMMLIFSTLACSSLHFSWHFCMALHKCLSSEDPALKRAHEVRETWHITAENVPLKHKKQTIKWVWLCGIWQQHHLGQLSKRFLHHYCHQALAGLIQTFKSAVDHP